jgi:hypothetical protein
LKTSGATIRVLTKGDGPPLLLLHGHPETHVTWHKIASRLAEKYTVVLPDLRGYGDSSKPDGGDNHINYFRAMALDQIEVMQQLGFARFMVAGHDRGGRVLDHEVEPGSSASRDQPVRQTQIRKRFQGINLREYWSLISKRTTTRPKEVGPSTPDAYDKLQDERSIMRITQRIHSDLT